MNRRSWLLASLALAFHRSPSAGEQVESAVDSSVLTDELQKHPRCVICNMDRRKFHDARHLLHYGDGSVQGTCSVHCAAECMLRERRRGFETIGNPPGN